MDLASFSKNASPARNSLTDLEYLQFLDHLHNIFDILFAFHLLCLL